MLVANGRWLRAPLLLAVALAADVFVATQDRVPAPPASIRAPWVDACVTRMEKAKLRLGDVSEELGQADVLQAWSVHSAWAELRLLPQYSARIEYRPNDDSPSVFDWEEAPTPVAGSFALHRRVGHYDLTVIADDSDDSGLAFAAKMQPLLDECLMEAE
ncbi:MAG TPA: hypothetical protein VN947_35840 [Polyangia bacterium]|nr:hypothetical protein [Polyangia bacterium]